MSKLSCLFIIQGEGRGHMTQALALKSMLVDAGHRVVAALIGHNERRIVPDYFLQKMDVPVVHFESPNFAVDADHQSVKVWPTVTQNLKKSTEYRESLDIIRRVIEETRPDVIVNFFEPLLGIFNLVYGTQIPIVCVGHQYMYHHPAYPFPSGQRAKRLGVKHFTRLTAFGAQQKLALSLYPAKDRPRLAVMPPLLRKELFELPLDQEESFFLIYLLNKGYAKDVIHWHKRYPEVVLHCFLDGQKTEEDYIYDSTLTFHRLHDTRFLEMMARCKGLVCTAGFESVCEAIYLGKPILSVPVKGHVEQCWNALDLFQYGGGIYDSEFNIERLLTAQPAEESLIARFRQWVDGAPELFVSQIEKVVLKKASRRITIQR